MIYMCFSLTHMIYTYIEYVCILRIFLIHSSVLYHNIDTSALHPYMVLLKYLFLNKNIWCVIFLYFV